MIETFVVIKAGKAAIPVLNKVPGAQRWGDDFIMPEGAWRGVVESFAYSVLSPRELASWRAMEFGGEPEYGVWMRNVNRAEVMRHTRAATWIGDACHITVQVYEAMRAQYYPWWQKAQEQVGWNLVKPSAVMWAASGDPRPAEMARYREELAAHDFSDGGPYKGSVIEKMAVRCDPAGKLLALAKSKYERSTK